ncbi:hypothetical protein ABZ914_37260 [Spirillospora sp. NPDC046719]
MAWAPEPATRRDLLLAAAVVAVQVLVWAVPDVSSALARVFDLGTPGFTDETAKTSAAVLSTCVAAGSIAVRRIAPVWALGGALVAALLAAGTGGTAVAWPFALVIALYSLAVHRTAGLAAAGAAATSLAVAAA